jgi:hypothetical protein
MMPLQSNGTNYTDKDNTMAQMRKSGPAKPAYKAGAKNDLVSKITNAYRVTAKEAAQIVKVVSESKPVLTGVNPAKEAAKFVGGAAKANVQLPGKVAGMAVKAAKSVAKDVKSGYNKK